MKKLFILVIGFFTVLNITAQNVGIGTSTPAYPLTVAANSAGTGIAVDKSNNSLFLGLSNSGSHARIATSNIPFVINTNTLGGFPGDFVINTTGNVGIGNDPVYPLDVSGRIRVRHTSNSAGIWFENSSNSGNNSFVGNYTDDYVGFYGNTGANWGFVMNVDNGNTGIGTTAPTSKLDINGAIRIRSGSPAAGSVLTSIDANGNAVWKEDNVAFKAYGMNSDYVGIPQTSIRRVHFGGEKFDLGNDYNLLPANATADANSSVFTVPVSGVYHFDVKLMLNSPTHETIGKAYMYLKLNRGGAVSTLASSDGSRSLNYSWADEAIFSFSTAESLLAGDKIYVEVVQYEGGTLQIGYGEDTWFSGFLVKAL